MEAQRAFLSAVSAERQKSWNKAEADYEEVLRQIYKTKWMKHFNKEKLRMLLFECHFHCAVALQNLKNYQNALRHFRRAMEVVSWRKDECQAGCITGRVLHLHVPTLARIACCHIHTGELNEALNSIEKAILLDFRNPDLFCIRSLVSFLLKEQEKALSDASFAIHLNPNQVCGWLLRGLFKKIKKEETQLKISKQERDLEKACKVNPDAVMFINIKDLKTHFQTLLDRFLPSARVSHSLSVRDVIDTEITSKPLSAKGRLESKQMLLTHTDHKPPKTCSVKTEASLSPPTFMCGVAKPQRRVRTCPPQLMKHSKANLERFHTEPSISHHKYSLHISSEHVRGTTLHGTSWASTCKSRAPCVTLREVVNTKSACVCDNRKFIGIPDLLKEDEGLEPKEDLPYLGERMYSRKWLQDRIPTKIPDSAGCRKLL